MSIGGFNQNNWVSSNLRSWLLGAGVFFVLGGVLYYIVNRSDGVDARNASSDSFQAVEKPGTTGVGPMGSAAPSLNTRMDQLEQIVGGYEAQVRRLQSAAESKRAVEQVQVAVLAAQVKSGRDRLQRLKTLEAAWQAKSAAILSDDSGRRIAASPTHLALAIGLLERESPSNDQILQWELQLDALGTPVEQATQNKESLMAVTAEHPKILTDLNLLLARTVTEVEQRQFLLDELLKETASRDPSTSTLQTIADERRSTQVRAKAERIAAACQAARDESEKIQTERLVKLEHEIVEAETRVKEAQRRSTIAGLTEQAVQADAALKELEEERAYERVLPQIKASLGSFTTPGFTLRNDKIKGPASFSFLEGQGAMVEGRPGLEALMFLASQRNDRTLVGLPSYIGGDSSWQNVPKAPVERAQELLVRWGPMMVKKGLLAP